MCYSFLFCFVEMEINTRTMQVREMKTILSFGFISTTVDLYIICLLFVCCSLNLV